MVWRDNLVFDDINFADYGVYVLDAKVNNGTKRDTESISVPGRNGDVHIDNGRYENIVVPYTCAIVEDADLLVQSLLAVLSSKVGYKRLEDSIHPEYYREGIFVGETEPRMFSRRNKGVFEVSFNCKPQKYLKLGEKEMSVSGTTKLLNPTLFDAKPVFKVTGTGTISVGSAVMTISQNPGNMAIDCDIEDVYNSVTKQNYNSYVTLSDGKFPVLSPGETGVTADGPTVTVIPRWWTV